MERKKVYDYIRVLACVCIIGIHSTGKSTYNYKDIWEVCDYVIHSFFVISLPVFFLLSGALAISGKKQVSVKEYYINKLIKIVIPFFLCSLFYAVWVNQGVQFRDCLNLETWKMMLKNVLPGIKGTLEIQQVTHLWFVYSILGIYLVTPFLKVMLQHMDESMIKTLAVLMFVMRCIKNYIPVLFGFKIGVDYIFSGWIMYFILGYIIIQPMMQKYYWLLEAGGVAAFFISLIVYAVFPQYSSDNYYDLAPHMVLQACGLFVFIYRREAVICRNVAITKVVEVISKYTFSIYLVHLFVIGKLNGSGLLEKMTDNIVAQGMIRIACVFVISFVLAVILDNSIIKVCQNLCVKVLKRTEK